MGSRFDGDDSDSYSGTWRVDHDQLVLHVIRSDKVLHDILGKDMRFIISDLQRDRFIATSPKTKQSRSLGNAVGDFHAIHLTILATTRCRGLSLSL